MLSVICFNLDQSKILLSGNGLKVRMKVYKDLKTRLSTGANLRNEVTENTRNLSKIIYK